VRFSFNRVIPALLAGGVRLLGSVGASGRPTAGAQWAVMPLPYREDYTVARAGTQVLIGGGRNPASDRVDIYDAGTGGVVRSSIVAGAVGDGDCHHRDVGVVRRRNHSGGTV